MAAKPIERFVKKQIADQGGWPRILERLASGETVADISRTLKRPDGQLISRNFLSMLLHADPERSAQVKRLQEGEQPDAMVDDALHIMDSAPQDRDGNNHAKGRAELRVKVAGFLNRQRWGEQRQAAVNVTVQSATLHVDALRHRMVEASRPLAELLESGDVAPQAPVDGASPACETKEPVTVRDQALQKDAEWLGETAS